MISTPHDVRPQRPLRCLIAGGSPTLNHNCRRHLEGVVTQLPPVEPWAVVATAAETLPDAVVLSTVSADRQALELCQQFQRLALTRHVGLVVVTEASTPIAAARLREIGVSQLLTSPLHPIALQACVRSAGYLSRSALELTRHCPAVDALTRLANRLAMLQALDGHVAAWSRHRQPFSLLVLRLKQLRSLNQRCGYDTGDDVLARCAQQLRQAIRAYDAAYRTSGATFGIILDRVEPTAAHTILNRLVSTLAAVLAEFPEVSIHGAAAAMTSELTGGELLNNAIESLRPIDAAPAH